jgi:hypothetical protein
MDLKNIELYNKKDFINNILEKNSGEKIEKILLKYLF